MGTIRDIARTGCDFLSIGQYLTPSKSSYPVKRYLAPEEFEYYGKKAEEEGFAGVQSGIYVRTSYNVSVALNSAREGFPAGRFNMEGEWPVL